MRTENRHLGYVGSSTCNLFDILNSFLSAYTYLGCWKDTARRAVPQIEGSDPRIRGSYRGRADAINKCYQVARQRKMIIFAVQNGGWCAAATNLNGYRKYGKAANCRNGKGGAWANDVYRITNPIKPAVPKGRSIAGRILRVSILYLASLASTKGRLDFHTPFLSSYS